MSGSAIGLGPDPACADGSLPNVVSEIFVVSHPRVRWDDFHPDLLEIKETNVMPDQVIPRVSVVIATYNRSRHIGRAIRSVLNQTITDIQVVVVDDGSEDDTRQIVNAFGDPRIEYVPHQVNRGLSAARNTGLRASKGEFFAVLDSDDAWMPTKLERQIEALDLANKEDVGFALCGSLIIEPDRQFVALPHLEGDISERIFALRAQYQNSYLVRSRILRDRLNYDERLRAFVDWDFLFRLSRATRCVSVNKPLLLNYNEIRMARLSNPESRIRAQTRIFAKYREEFAEHPKATARHYVKRSEYLSKRTDLRACRSSLVAAIRRDKQCWRAYFYLIGSLLGSRAFRVVWEGVALISTVKRTIRAPLTRVASRRRKPDQRIPTSAVG